MNKKLLFFMVSLILIKGIFGLGIIPGRTNVDFSPYLEKEIGFSVINTEHKNMNVAFSVEGDLKDYVFVDNNAVKFNSNEDLKSFKYKIKLPRKLSPGLHKAKIIALELPENINDENMVVKASVSVVTQLYVHVSYPGKYIDASLDIVNKKGSKEVEFYVPFICRGEESIKSVKSVIDIYKGDKKIDSINTNELSAEKGDRKELKGVWNPKVSPGKYHAVANVEYDGNKIKLEKDFNIGPEEFGVLGISVNDFKLGGVAKIKILVQNKLSDDVKNAFANLKVYNSELKKIANLKSADYNIPAKSNKEMVVYWDTENVEKGRYGSELDINYEKKFLRKKFKIDVSEDSMTFSGIGFVVGEGVKGKIKTNQILYVVIGFLVLINLSWLVWWIRSKKKK